MTPAVFLDRDGTIIEDVGYLDSVARVSLFPCTVDALRVLRREGFRLVVVTNQSGIARGKFAEALVGDVHRHLDERLGDGGVAIDGYYYCPHHVDGAVEAYRLACDCRKPLPGLVARAARELDLDVPRSYVIGDHWSDVALADAAGARGGLLVRTGSGASQAARPVAGVRAAAVVDRLIEAASWILVDHRRRAA